MAPSIQAGTRLLRSLLFIPADSKKKIDKARGLRPDGIIFDLEDAVTPDQKLFARHLIQEVLGSFRHTCARIFVRVNGVGTAWFEADLVTAVCESVAGIVLPKSEDARIVARVAELIATTEAEKGIAAGQVCLLPIIESALGVLRADQIASTHDRVTALLFGAEDYCADMGMRRSSSGEELSYARSVIVHAARAARISALDAVFTDLSDEIRLLEEIRRASQMGFTGKLLIHPRQIAVTHRAFAPGAKEIDWAERVVAAFAEAEEKGGGIITIDGKMVDQPVVLQARQLLLQRNLAEEADK